MSEIQKSYIGCILIALLILGNTVINNVTLSKFVDDKLKVLLEAIDDLKILTDDNRSRLEKKIFDCNKCSDIKINVDSKSFAKLLLLTTKMQNSLLNETKFDNQFHAIKPLIVGLTNHEIEDAVNELTNIKEVCTIVELQSFFEKIVNDIYYEEKNLAGKIISNWVKIKKKNDSLRSKWTDIRELIDENDWRGIDNISKNLTNSQFKLWVNKLNNFVLAYRNILVIHNYLTS
ncbi:MAG: hypothetical protein KTV77_00815 [Wolbachia endosymbiont of Fragariocoptes setiger]|nr:hypothetical protein [Wolbachia endosymbiont of Fragariocoptes setiger]